MICLACHRLLPEDMFFPTRHGRRRICQDCYDTGAVTDELRREIKRLNARAWKMRNTPPEPLEPTRTADERRAYNREWMRAYRARLRAA